VSRKTRKRREQNAGAFLGPDMLVPAPIRTLSDDYRDEPTEPEPEPEPAPESPPEPPGIVRRMVDRLARLLSSGR
jgi:hypothetical protein